MAIYRIHIHSGGPPVRPPGLLTRIGVAIATALVLIGSLFLGAVIFAVVAVVAVLGYAAFMLRLWWFKRQLSRAMEKETPSDSFKSESRSHRHSDVIDVEYTEKDT
ncbi:MAG TPA: hypothetical protein PJ991_08340 [Kiritimatiellia bacterium]|nr:hypothetical protein [Kiritimatiellia bacterium]